MSTAIDRATERHEWSFLIRRFLLVGLDAQCDRQMLAPRDGLTRLGV